MTSRRENLLRVLRHAPPEWVPVCGHVDPYNQPDRRGMDPELAEALGTVAWGDESTVRFSRHLGIDIMDWFSGTVRCERSAVAAERRTEGEDTVTTWHTPRGDLRQVQRRCRGDGTSYYVEHLVKTPADLDALAAAFECESCELSPDRMAVLRRRREMVGDDGLIGAPLPGTPLGMMIRVYAGVETTAFLHADASDALRDLFAVMERSHLRQFRLAATADVDVLIGVDDTSTTTQSPAMFETYCVDYTNRIADAVHALGKFYLHHSCGLIRDLLGLYRQTRMDGVHALQVPPMGNVTIREAKERLGPGIVIMASLTHLFGQMNDWEAVRRSVRDIFEGAAPGDNFILGLAADPGHTMAETERLLGECRRWQKLYSRNSEV